MAMVPKTMVIQWYFEFFHTNKIYSWVKGKTVEYNLRQDLFEALFISNDFAWAYYLNPSVCHGHMIHDQYWNKILKLFGWDKE